MVKCATQMSLLGFIDRCSYFVALFVLADRKELKQGGWVRFFFFLGAFIFIFEFINTIELTHIKSHYARNPSLLALLFMEMYSEFSYLPVLEFLLIHV